MEGEPCRHEKRKAEKDSVAFCGSDDMEKLKLLVRKYGKPRCFKNVSL
jgi:hypothetical protein